MGRLFEIFVDGLAEPFQVRADPAEDDLIDLRERRLLRAWQRRRFVLQRAPARGELDAGLLGEVEPNLMELALLDNGDFEYTHYGTAIARAHGRDMTGQRTSDLPWPIAKAFLSVYRLALKTRIPYATRHRASPPSREGHWHRLILPVYANARAVGGFLVCNVPIER